MEEVVGEEQTSGTDRDEEDEDAPTLLGLLSLYCAQGAER
jgi:hypothetical protein